MFLAMTFKNLNPLVVNLLQAVGWGCDRMPPGRGHRTR